MALVACKSSPDGGKAPLQELQSVAENVKMAPSGWSMAEWEWEDGALQSQTKERLSRPPNVCQIRCLSLRLILQDNEDASFTQSQDSPWSPLPRWVLEQVSPLIAVSQMVIALRALLTWAWLVSKLDACLSSVGLKSWGAWSGTQIICSSGSSSGFWVLSRLWATALGGKWGLPWDYGLASSTGLDMGLPSFSLRPVFRFFSDEVVPYLAIYSMSSWEKVSSGSS